MGEAVGQVWEGRRRGEAHHGRMRDACLSIYTHTHHAHTHAHLCLSSSVHPTALFTSQHIVHWVYSAVCLWLLPIRLVPASRVGYGQRHPCTRCQQPKRRLRLAAVEPPRTPTSPVASHCRQEQQPQQQCRAQRVVAGGATVAVVAARPETRHMASVQRQLHRSLLSLAPRAALLLPPLQGDIIRRGGSRQGPAAQLSPLPLPAKAMKQWRMSDTSPTSSSRGTKRRLCRCQLHMWLCPQASATQGLLRVRYSWQTTETATYCMC